MLLLYPSWLKESGGDGAEEGYREGVIEYTEEWLHPLQ